MKKKLTAAIIIVLLAVLALSALLILNKGHITDTKTALIEENGNGVWLITHEMSRGNSLQLSLSQNVTALSEDIYKVDILFNQSDNRDYSVENIVLLYRVGENDEIISQYYGVGNGNYKVGEIYYNDGTKICCRADGNYIWCSFIIRSDSPDRLAGAEAVELTYDIVGHFPYSLGRAYDIDPFK
ncbi:MAG: hypothetical protein ACI4XF_06465 [Oscillospiraceae bacterium]